MTLPPWWFTTALLLLISASPAVGQRDRHHEDDEYIKLGTRIPRLPPGEGGHLSITAPERFCSDGEHLLNLNYHPPGFMGGTILLMRADPPCRWQIDDLREGEYTATIEEQVDRQIVATARGQVLRGATQTLAFAPVQTGVEGTVRFNGSLPTAGFNLVFRNESKRRFEWKVPIDSAGGFRAALDASVAEERICLFIERDPPLNSVSVGCREFLPGLQRLDLDANVPRGVLRIEVPPVPTAGFGTFAQITISDNDRVDQHLYMTSFKLIRGLRGDYLADLDRDFRIVASRIDRTVLASARVTLSTDHPGAAVRLLVGPEATPP